MKLTKKKLDKLVEQAVRKRLMEAAVFVDPTVVAFDDMLASIERVGSMLNAEDPVYPKIENILVAAEDAYESFVGEG